MTSFFISLQYGDYWRACITNTARKKNHISKPWLGSYTITSSEKRSNKHLFSELKPFIFRLGLKNKQTNMLSF